MKCELCGADPMTAYCNNADCEGRCEPTEDDLAFLNKIDGGYVGITRPKVARAYDQGLSIPLTKAITEDGDRNPRFDADME